MTPTLKKAGIAIETWKLPIFERHLKQAGYAVLNIGEVTDDTLLLFVETTNADALREVLMAAMREAARTGAPHA